MRRFKAFTLTELLIALTVLGILVAIVTPAIVKTRPNKNKMMVKKTYYTTETIVSSLINDERLYPDKREACYEGNTAECAWGFDDETEVNYEGQKYKGEDKFAKLFVEKLNVKSADDTSYVYYTNDGVKWDLSNTAGKGEGEYKWKSGKVITTTGGGPGTFDKQDDNTAGVGLIIIDVNGDEGPNTECGENVEDCDIYGIEILANGKMRIYPENTKAIEYVTINTSIRDNIK